MSYDQLRGQVIDVDVRHDWPAPEALLPYLSSAWREQVVGYPRGALYPMFPRAHLAPPPGTELEGSVPEEGAPGSDYELLRAQLLDRSGIECAVLGFGQGRTIAANLNPYLAAELTRAANDWSIDTWLGLDERFVGSMLVPNQLPELAAEEVRRIGVNDRIVAIRLAANGVGSPFGHPVFHPIYEAAEELGLVVAVEGGADGAGGWGISPTAGGHPSLYVEHHALLPQSALTHLVSMIAHGVFEKYPRLRVLVVGAGVAWLPWFLWRCDVEFDDLRRETPWLERRPSEYVRDQVRVSTQRLETSPDPGKLIELLGLVDASELLCFGSAYPQWDSDDTESVAARLPPEWQPAIFRDNAAALFDLPVKGRHSHAL